MPLLLKGPLDLIGLMFTSQESDKSPQILGTLCPSSLLFSACVHSYANSWLLKKGLGDMIRNLSNVQLLKCLPNIEQTSSSPQNVTALCQRTHAELWQGSQMAITINRLFVGPINLGLNIKFLHQLSWSIWVTSYALTDSPVLTGM